MTQTLSNGSSPAESTGQSPLAVLDPQTIKLFNDQREAKAIVDWVSSQYKKSKSARQRYERQWALNMAFYRGKQNLQYFSAPAGSPLSGKLWAPPAPPWAARTITNRIRPIIRTEMARLTSNKPNASVVPASSEDQDLFAAQAAEQVWESMYSGKQIHKTFTSTMFWMTICGTAFIKDWYDPNAYDCVTKENGSIEYATVTPFHLFIPDLNEEDIEKQPWVINAYTKPVEWVKNCYGIEVNADVVESKSPFDSAMLETAMGTNEAKPDSVLVMECWIKPKFHHLFPEGGYVTVAGNTIVGISDEWPYQHKQFPFTKFDHIATGQFYAESVITDLIQPQREYNRTKNQIIESKNRMSKPQLVAPKGSVDPSKITSEPGQVIEYRPGLDAPRPLPLQPIPNYVLTQLDLEIRDMEDISSQHQVSRGQAPPGVTAATAISFMQERDDSLMTTAYQSVEFGYEKIAKHTISHVVQFWTVERTVSVTGLDGSFDSVALKGSELQSGTDIRMEAGSALPVSKAAKQAFLLDMMKMGFIDPNKGLSLLDMGGLDKLYDELKIDERQAQRENLRMSRLEVEKIFQHSQIVAQQHQLVAQQTAMMQQQQMGEMGMPMGGPEMQTGSEPLPGMEMPQQGMPMGMSPQQGMEGMPPGIGPKGLPTDPVTGMPLEMPLNIVPVNTWDNHQVHIEVHNRYRKSQAFELLPQAVREQFEAHVMMHANALNAAANAAMMMPPPGEGGMGAENGSGTPLGQNQFGPPGTEDGAPPPEMMG